MDSAVRFYLARDANIDLNANVELFDHYRSEFHNPTEYFTSSLQISAVRPVDTQHGKDNEQLWNEINSMFQNRVLNLSLELSTLQFPPMNRHVTYAAQQDIGNKSTKIEVSFEGIFKEDKAITQKGKSFILEAEIFNFGSRQPQQRYRPPTAFGVQHKNIRSREMQITSSKPSELRYVDASYNPAIENIFNIYYDYGHISGKVNIFLTAKVSEQSPFFPEPTENNKTAIYKRILEEELATDAVILPSNGVEVKCHRSFLSAHSDVFQTMLTTDMVEAKTQKIEIPDISEKGVRAFLAYLYYWDKSQAEKSSAVAVELLKAGHKYNIIFLEQAMRNLLLSKQEVWFDVDAAMKLFLFVRNLDAEWEPFKKKAVLALKKKSPDLRNSPTVKDLFRDNSEAALDFCQYAISM